MQLGLSTSISHGAAQLFLLEQASLFLCIAKERGTVLRCEPIIVCGMIFSTMLPSSPTLGYISIFQQPTAQFYLFAAVSIA